jgi:Domain of unknown function (DUF4865)
MLAMHYQIPLSGADAVAAVRTRAAERGPLFDDMPGLAHKLFLIDPIDPCYATFYLWQDPDAARAFIEGPFFAALTSAFGRPEVFLLFTSATCLPFAAGDRVALAWRNAASPAGAETLDALDPRTGAILGLGPIGAGGRCFEIMYHARGQAAAAP